MAIPWLLATEKPVFLRLAITVTSGNFARNMATEPSTELLSTTITSTNKPSDALLARLNLNPGQIDHLYKDIENELKMTEDFCDLLDSGGV